MKPMLDKRRGRHIIIITPLRVKSVADITSVVKFMPPHSLSLIATTTRVKGGGEPQPCLGLAERKKAVHQHSQYGVLA